MIQVLNMAITTNQLAYIYIYNTLIIQDQNKGQTI